MMKAWRDLRVLQKLANSLRGPSEVSQDLVGKQYASLPLQGLPGSVGGKLEENDLFVAEVEGAGRGLFTAKARQYGDVILKEKPFVCHPALDKDDRVCYHCLEGKISSHDTSSQRHNFCSVSCTSAARKYIEAEEGGAFEPLDDFCRANNLRFPLLIKRLACRALIEGSFACCQDTAYLVHAKIADVPQQHLQSFALLYHGCKTFLETTGDPQSKQLLNNLSLDWYMRTYSRTALNSFRVEGLLAKPANAKQETSFGDMFEHGVLGSALYLTAAMLNHSCMPNVSVNHMTNNGKATFLAARDIDKGEQLFITYIDNELPKKERQQHLLWNYGFNCRCEVCQDEQRPD